MNPNSARSNPKNQAQRNITPNFLRFKRTTHLTQASPSPENQKIKDSIATAPKEATPNPTADAPSKSPKKESSTSAPSVPPLSIRKKSRNQSQGKYSRSSQKTQRRTLSNLPKRKHRKTPRQRRWDQRQPCINKESRFQYFLRKSPKNRSHKHKQIKTNSHIQPKTLNLPLEIRTMGNLAKQATSIKPSPAQLRPTAAKRHDQKTHQGTQNKAIKPSQEVFKRRSLDQRIRTSIKELWSLRGARKRCLWSGQDGPLQKDKLESSNQDLRETKVGLTQ